MFWPLGLDGRGIETGSGGPDRPVGRLGPGEGAWGWASGGEGGGIC